MSRQEGARVTGSWADARAAAMAEAAAEAAAEALAPFRWRELTDEMLARRVVGAIDRYVVLRLVAAVPGATAGGVGPVEPADRDDARVRPLVRTLGARPWRGFSLERVCAELIAVLTAWQAARDAAGGPGGTMEDR
jgi:hypothetical protein